MKTLILKKHEHVLKSTQLNSRVYESFSEEYITVRSFCRNVLVVRRLSVPEVGTANNEDFKRLNVLTHLLLVLGAERRDEIIL